MMKAPPTLKLPAYGEKTPKSSRRKFASVSETAWVRNKALLIHDEIYA